jgi:hypothetical protein
MAAKLTRLTHKIAIQLLLVTADNLQFSFQAASPETFRYTRVHVYEFNNTACNNLPYLIKIIKNILKKELIFHILH